MACLLDANDRLYVADEWNNRIQVFDKDGNYLTTIGGSWGSRTGQLRGAHGVAVDSAGNVYVADYSNHRIQKFAPGVPGWVQSNINGFGDQQNLAVTALASFGGWLYAGTWNSGGNGAQLWRADSSWAAVTTDGFGDPTNYRINHLVEFQGHLYAGTANWDSTIQNTLGGQIWRSSDGLNWTTVISQGFGDPTNGDIFRLAVFSDTLYASTWSWTSTHGTEIWRSTTGDAGSWEQVSDGFGDVRNRTVLSFEVFNGCLYAGTYNLDPTTYISTGGEVWRSATGNAGDWVQVNADGFGNPDNRYVRSFAAFKSYLYAGTSNPTSGGQMWRCSAASGCDENSDWQQVISNGFGNTNNTSIDSLIVFDNMLYAMTYNGITGAEVWCSKTGDPGDWEQVGFAGFGDSNNYFSYWDGAMAVSSNRLYIGTYNPANGGEVWRKLVVTADFTASPTEGVAPLAVTFTNTSSGDYTSSLWDFGDGITSTLESPTHVYTSGGVYTVTLTMSGFGVSDTEMKPGYITVRYGVYLPLILRNH